MAMTNINQIEDCNLKMLMERLWPLVLNCWKVKIAERVSTLPKERVSYKVLTVGLQQVSFSLQEQTANASLGSSWNEKTSHLA